MSGVNDWPVAISENCLDIEEKHIGRWKFPTHGFVAIPDIKASD